MVKKSQATTVWMYKTLVNKGINCLPKTNNSTPKNGGFQQESHFPEVYFQRRAVSFSEGMLLLYVGVVLFPWKSFLQSDKMVVPSLDDDNSLLKILVETHKQTNIKNGYYGSPGILSWLFHLALKWKSM